MIGWEKGIPSSAPVRLQIAAGRDVADDDLDHQDVDAFHLDVGFVDLADEVGGDACSFRGIRK